MMKENLHKNPIKTFTAHALQCYFWVKKARNLSVYCMLPSSIALKLEFYHKRIEEEVKWKWRQSENWEKLREHQ
jgi:hypothetical protein